MEAIKAKVGARESGSMKCNIMSKKLNDITTWSFVSFDAGNNGIRLRTIEDNFLGSFPFYHYMDDKWFLGDDSVSEEYVVFENGQSVHSRIGVLPFPYVKHGVGVRPLMMMQNKIVFGTIFNGPVYAVIF